MSYPFVVDVFSDRETQMFLRLGSIAPVAYKKDTEIMYYAERKVRTMSCRVCICDTCIFVAAVAAPRHFDMSAAYACYTTIPSSRARFPFMSTLVFPTQTSLKISFSSTLLFPFAFLAFE